MGGENENDVELIKYREQALRIAEEEGASVVIVTVVGGKRGSGTALCAMMDRLPIDDVITNLVRAPRLMRELADKIEQQVAAMATPLANMPPKGAPS